jgi:phospholipid/cholesterol/gamma-HCH transport system substrate-binding protein
MRFSDIPRGGAQKTGMSPLRAGILAVIVIGLFTYFGFTKANPFSNPYELNAIVKQANRLAQRSPVRIGGVNVGKVVGVEPVGDGSGLTRVKMEINDAGLPIHKDAQVSIRARLFLEGNWLVDVKPGRPGSPELESGSTIPHNQTSGPVQFSQVLTALQSETREDLQRLLKEYSSALRGSGARGFNQAIKHWEEAYRTTSQVNDATLGTEDHDLTRVLRGQARVLGALSDNPEALENLVTDLNDTISGFAREENNLRTAIPELRDVLREGRPALASLDRALPSIRAFARDALPGARSTSPTLDAQIPFIKQARRLVARRELGGLARLLRRTVPSLVRLNRRSRLTLAQNRALASCQNNVLLPFAKTPIPDPDFPFHTNQPWYKESGRAFVGLSGESRIHDANTPMFRVQQGGGPTTIVSTGEALDDPGAPVYGQALFPIDGVRPIRPTDPDGSGPLPDRPIFRPDVPCETQEPPNLNAAPGEGDQQVQAKATKSDPKEAQQLRKAYAAVSERARRGLSEEKVVAPLKKSLRTLIRQGRRRNR